jgi:hypothetical protein
MNVDLLVTVDREGIPILVGGHRVANFKGLSLAPGNQGKSELKCLMGGHDDIRSEGGNG